MEFSEYNWATISETICPQMLIFGKQASWTLIFQNILTNPIISEISFLCRHTFVLYSTRAFHQRLGIFPSLPDNARVLTLGSEFKPNTVEVSDCMFT